MPLPTANGRSFDAADLTGEVELENGGTQTVLSVPAGDRLLMWDASAGAMVWLEIGVGLEVSAGALVATGGGGDPDPGPGTFVETLFAGADGMPFYISYEV